MTELTHLRNFAAAARRGGDQDDAAIVGHRMPGHHPLAGHFGHQRSGFSSAKHENEHSCLYR